MPAHDARPPHRRRVAWPRHAALVATCLLGVGTGAAAAAGATVVLGTHGNDTIDASGRHGDVRIYGLAGRDVIVGGKGTSLLVGDGHCPAGTRGDNLAGVRSDNGSDDAYCDDAEVADDPGDILRGGTGDNTLIGGGGPNVMYGGSGHNVFRTGSRTSGVGRFNTGNVIYGGPAGDVVFAMRGTSTIYAGAGANVIDTRNGRRDYVLCTGHRDRVIADPIDIVRNCARTDIGVTGRGIRRGIRHLSGARR